MVRAGLMWEVQPCVVRGADASRGWASVAQILRCNTSVEGCRGGGEIRTKQFPKHKERSREVCRHATILQDELLLPLSL
eukprot:scaffold33059_cov65-Phaeocystis_antarctica.AAC.1